MGTHGYLMSGQTAAWIRSQMERKAPSAADGATRRVRPAVVVEDEFARPFEVRFASGNGTDDPGKWIIWLPSDSMLIVNGEPVDLTDELEEAGDPYPEGWYVLDFLPEEGGDVYLNVRIPEGGDGESEVTAEFASTADQPEEGFVLYPIKIAECSSGGVKSTVASAIVLGGGSGSAAVDEVSVDKLGGESGAALELAHFADGSMDSGLGLEKRLKSDPETGVISATGESDIMLVARKDGRVIYIPLSGSGEDPGGGKRPGCDDHPGGGDAVSPDDDVGHGGGSVIPVSGGGSGSVPIGGGVPDVGHASCCD